MQQRVEENAFDLELIHSLPFRVIRVFRGSLLLLRY